MTPVPKSDPAWVAALNARMAARHARHEAEHAVAAVARGGELIRVSLGTFDWGAVLCWIAEQEAKAGGLDDFR
jgi:phage terminase large subunit-like protein